jgi:hypothetical protein
MRQRTHQAATLAAGILFPVMALAVPGTDAVLPAAGGTEYPAVSAEPLPAVLHGADLPVIETITIDAPADPVFGAAVDAERLDGMRGGDGNVTTTTSRATLRGGVNGNTATNVVSGTNLLSDGSFGNAAGISTVIQNSGSNVLIQNSTIVNVQFVPTP